MIAGLRKDVHVLQRRICHAEFDHERWSDASELKSEEWLDEYGRGTNEERVQESAETQLRKLVCTLLLFA